MNKKSKPDFSEWEKLPVLDQILADLAIYYEPDLLKEEHRAFFDFSMTNKKQIEKYRDLLLSIMYAWQKIQRYELYFTSFYPESSEISEVEALNHHIQSYLQDITIFKNKILAILGELKNDIPKVASNADEVKNFFRIGIDTIKNTFSGVAESRNPHTHKGMRFFDGQLIKGENAQGALKLLSEHLVKEVDNLFTAESKKEFFEKLRKDEEESVRKTKEWWIIGTRKNAKQSTEMLNKVLLAVRPAMYKFLKVRSPTKEISSIFSLS